MGQVGEKSRGTTSPGQDCALRINSERSREERIIRERVLGSQGLVRSAVTFGIVRAFGRREGLAALADTTLNDSSGVSVEVFALEETSITVFL